MGHGDRRVITVNTDAVFLTLDVGTTAVKAALFDRDLHRIGIVIQEYSLLTYGDGVVELPTHVYWDTTVLCVRELLAETGMPPGRVVSLTCTTQGETLIPVSMDGTALYNAVVWLDARAKTEAEELAGLYTNEDFYRVTGVPEINAYCPLAKLMWFRNRQPEIYARTCKFLLLEDYLIFLMTGLMVSNPSMLCTTGYFDIQSNVLWDDIFRRTGLDASKIPEIRNCGEIIGPLTESAALSLGLTTAVVVTSGAMDQTAASIGAGGLRLGVLAETTGTCLAVGAAAYSPCMDTWKSIPVYSHVQSGVYLKIAVMQTAGIILKWFRDEFCRDLILQNDNAFVAMDRLAGGAPPLSRGLICFPHFAGMAAEPGARGVFFGMNLETGRDCFIRSIMEAVGYMLKDSLDLLDTQNNAIHSMGGGAKSDIWNQIKADICGKPVYLMEEEETASLGAAVLGMLAVGRFVDIRETSALIKTKRVYTPDDGAAALYSEGYARYARLCQHMAGIFK